MIILEAVFQISLIVATLFCILVNGFILLYAIVVMPGFAKLKDGEFLRAFQVTDGIIQDDQPLFLTIWLGSIIAIIIATVLGFLLLDGFSKWLLLILALVYVLGVHLPSFKINFPLNNHLQTLDIDNLSLSEHAAERERFESRWNQVNVIRTAIASLVSVLLIILLIAI